MEHINIEKIAEQIAKSISYNCIKLDEARLLIREVEAEAERKGVKAVVAVADNRARTIAVECMDDAFIASFKIATGKAYTSVALKMPTKDLSKLAAVGGELYGIENSDEKIIIFGGGVPLYFGERIVGGLGVSGGTAEEDTYLGDYASKKFREIMNERMG